MEAVKPKRSITMACKDLDSSGNVIVTKISYPMDNQIDGYNGTPITYKLFDKMIRDNFTKTTGVDDAKKIAYVFGKQELMLMLSFKECLGLAFCPCLRPEVKDKPQTPSERESMVVFAINEEDTKGRPEYQPLRPSVIIGNSNSEEKNNIVADEWVHGITIGELKKWLKANQRKEEDVISLKDFFNFFSEKSSAFL